MKSIPVITIVIPDKRLADSLEELLTAWRTEDLKALLQSAKNNFQDPAIDHLVEAIEKELEIRRQVQ